MARSQNIFYNIVNSENSMTELLCNFMAFKPFRNAFIKLFFENDPELVSFDDIQTQYTTDINQSRPDMVFSNDDCEFLIEIKIWDTGLTINQPKSYLEYLKNIKKQNKCLVFLIPSNYCHLNEWKRRSDEWFKENQCNIPIKIVYWNEIINCIENNDLNVFGDQFRDFHDLLKSTFEIKQITFSRVEVKYMFSPEMPRSLIKLYAIIDQVKNYFSQIYSVSKSMNNEEYGIYIRRREDKSNLLYLGVWYPFWEEQGCPLCYGVDIAGWSKDVVEIFSAIHKDESIVCNGFKTVMIKRDILEDEKCTERIINLIKQELEMLSYV